MVVFRIDTFVFRNILFLFFFLANCAVQSSNLCDPSGSLFFKTAALKILAQDSTSFCGMSLPVSKNSAINNSGLRQWSTLLGVAGATTNSLGVSTDDSGNVYLTGSTNGNLDGRYFDRTL
ncbi:hypothetical protein A0128_07865 [Leptospira tipperaryensis]|uniref:Beta-propeller repeat protein n=1 Tax=Leptospira tipperaryensis TaxID=2564040 RepID=A0A1D7UW39_9LEPT|nr:SBBP repeat-containing protein [Leptospira tipperaryensis]AOP33764.1 hypothetical protein A0128_07865 [Leptospira tipperaryensis]